MCSCLALKRVRMWGSVDSRKLACHALRSDSSGMVNKRAGTGLPNSSAVWSDVGRAGQAVTGPAIWRRRPPRLVTSAAAAKCRGVCWVLSCGHEVVRWCRSSNMSASLGFGVERAQIGQKDSSYSLLPFRSLSEMCEARSEARTLSLRSVVCAPRLSWSWSQEALAALDGVAGRLASDSER
jgi:hypothetical protein